MEAIAVCLFGMESTVSFELKNLGFEIVKVTDGRVSFRTDERGIAKANISLRCAERVLIKVGEFRAKTFTELFDEVQKLPFEKYLRPDSKFHISKVRSINSKLISAPDIQSVTKKSIVNRLMRAHNVTSLPEIAGEHNIHIFINKDIVELSFDTTGAPLHKRGYRKLSGEAPLRETIAAFMVMMTPWNPGRLLVDPMCGSGTILIEAALYGANIMPGINRNFAGEELQFISQEAWKAVRKEALKEERREAFKIYGFDTNPEILDLAKDNARLAGVDEYIEFKQKDARKINTNKEYGFVVSNPPFGERIGEREEIALLYKALGETFKKMSTWSFFIISSVPDTEDLLGRKAAKKRKIYNGALTSNIYCFPGPKPPKKEI